MSRLQPSTSSESPPSASAPGDSSPNRAYLSEHPSSSTHPRVSEGSEGYPSWLPKRPPPPAPASTFHSSVAMFEPPPLDTFSGSGVVGVGRKATARSVRVVSLQDTTAQANINPYHHRRDSTDPTSLALGNPLLPPRVWSRATAGLSATLSQAVNAHAHDHHHRQPPKFRSTGLHPELLRNPSILARLYFYLLPLMTFYHIPLQTFFDFNAVFIILQVARFPNPSAPGVSGSGKNWALGAAAYIACWLAWISMVFVLYELIYSFSRRWRVKRPLITPLYLSSSAFNLTCMTSYTHFCFMQYIRFSAFFGENGSLSDGIAETFWFYSQNVATVALLLPRAGLCVALLLAYTVVSPDYVAMMLEAGFNYRDETYFRATDGTLTGYARGVLFANAAWTAWRFLVLFFSWIGLWILSGQGCAGLCGPRYRWEEEEQEKPTYGSPSDGVSEADALSWSWRVCTRLRIQEAYDFCLTVKPPARWSSGGGGGGAKKKYQHQHQQQEADSGGLLGVETSPPFEVEQVLAAVGFPSAPPMARRRALSDDLFARPSKESGEGSGGSPELSGIIPKVVKRSSKEKEMGGASSGPLMKLPYPFSGYGAQVSSKDQIPFPPSPGSRKEKRRSPGTTSSERSGQAVEDVNNNNNNNEEEEEEAEGEEVEVETEAQPRTSGSMSSLGQPVMSRYPFQLRRPTRGGSISSSAAGTHSTPRTHVSTNTRSTESRTTHSTSTRSTGNRETSSESPTSLGMSSGMSSPSSGYGSPIPMPIPMPMPMPMPMPPRHPTPGRGRARAGTVPSMFPSSPSPMVFTSRGGRTRMRVDSDHTETTFGGAGYGSFFGEEIDDEEDEQEGDGDVLDEEDEEGEGGEVEIDESQMMMMMMEQPVPEGPQEAAEGEDSVGLLAVVGTRSPRSSTVSSRRRGHRCDSGRSSRSRSHSRSVSVSGSGSGSGSRSGSGSGSSGRLRAQSLIQSLGAASRSSLDLVRSRANSFVARLEDVEGEDGDGDAYLSSSDSRSRSGSENYTFGVRPRMMGVGGGSQGSSEFRMLRGAYSNPSIVTRGPLISVGGSSEVGTVPYGVRDGGGVGVGVGVGSGGGSRADISTAAQSFVTAPATLASTTASSEVVPASWREAAASHMVDRPGTEWRPA